MRDTRSHIARSVRTLAATHRSRLSLNSAAHVEMADAAKTLTTSWSAAADKVKHDAYTPGSIKKIELVNFMTHQHVIMYPTARVNFVLGANGSGKSSLVCALCLGLGGDPGHMERGAKLENYVMTGKDSATIKITLAGRPTDKSADGSRGDIEVVRTLNARGGPNKWRINGEEKSTEAALSFLREEMRIDMGNKCMFLPQEKVGTFAMLTPQELLGVVMQSVHRDVVTLFNRIKKMESEMSQEALDSQARRAELEKWTTAWEAVQESDDKLTKFRALGEKIELLKLRRVFALLNELRATHAARQAALADFHRKSEELAEATVAPKKEAEATRAAAASAAAAATASHGGYTLAQQAIGRLSTQLQAQRDRVKEQEARMRELAKGRNDAAAALETAQKTLQREQAALAKAQKECDAEGALAAEREVGATIGGLQTAAMDADAEARGAEEEVRAAEARRREVAGKLARLGDYRLKRRELLASGGGGLGTRQLHVNAAAIEAELRRGGPWSGTVYGPLLAEVHIKGDDPGGALATAVEAAVPAYLRCAWAVDHPADFERIRHLNLAGMNIVSIQRPSAAEILAGIRRPLDAAALAAWSDALCGGSSSGASSSAGAGAGAGAGASAAAGGLRYMDTLFDAPPLVKAALVQETSIHNMLFTPAIGAVVALNAIMTARDRAHGGSSGAGGGAARQDLGKWPMALSLRTPAQTLRVSVNMDGVTTRSGVSRVPDIRTPCLTLRPDDEAQRRLRGEDAAAADAAAAARSRVTAAMQTKSVHEDALAAARAKLAGLRQTRNMIKGLESRVVTAQRAVKERQEALNSDAAAEAQLKACVLARRQGQLGLLTLYQKLEGVAKAAADAQAAAQAATAAAAAASRSAAAAAAAYETAQGNLKGHERSKDALSREAKAAKTALSAGEEDYEKNVRQSPLLQGPDRPAEFAALPATLAEVQQAIADLEAERQYLALDSEEVARVNNVRHNYERSKAACAKYQDEANRLEAARDKDRDKWRARMEPIVERIGDAFRAGLKTINVAGQVELEGGEEGMTSSQGLVIRVAFRKAGELEALSKDRQSGGEKALTTMMFLLAMQAVTPLPFRIVDEINQGMDAANERAVMTQLLAMANSAEGASGAGGGGAGSSSSDSSGSDDEDASAAGAGAGAGRRGGSAAAAPAVAVEDVTEVSVGHQLFIISPKLLPDMQHSPLIRTEIVVNGAKVGPGERPTELLATRFLDFTKIATDIRLAAGLKFGAAAAGAGAGFSGAAGSGRKRLPSARPGAGAGAGAGGVYDLGGGNGGDDDDDQFDDQHDDDDDDGAAAGAGRSSNSSSSGAGAGARPGGKSTGSKGYGAAKRRRVGGAAGEGDDDAGSYAEA